MRNVSHYCEITNIEFIVTVVNDTNFEERGIEKYRKEHEGINKLILNKLIFIHPRTTDSKTAYSLFNIF